MFNKGPTFINASDVLNVSEPDFNIIKKNIETKPVQKEIKNSLEEKLQKEIIEEPIKTDIKQPIESNNNINKYRYSGDDIPWIF